MGIDRTPYNLRIVTTTKIDMIIALKRPRFKSELSAELPHIKSYPRAYEKGIVDS